MVKPKKKVNFNKIWEFIQEIDQTAGVFLFRDTTKKMTRKEKLLTLTWPTHAFLGGILIISTLVSSKFKLINVIFCTLFLMGYVLFYTMLMKLRWNKDTVKDIIKWCDGLYDIEKKWHPLIQTATETYLMSLEQRTLKYLKWFRILCYLDAFIMTAGSAIIGFLLPESIYPKFAAPLPFCLPFKHQETWFAFVTTTASETALIVLTVPLGLQCLGFFFCIAMHIFGYLDIIEQTITGKFKQELLTKQMKVENIEDDDEPQPSTSRLQLSVLAVINQSTVAKAGKKDETSFNEWMAILTEMILDVNSIVNYFKELYSVFFLHFEMGSLACVFFTGLIFIVIRQQYFFGIGLALIPTLLYIICYINEKILDKFDDIKEALYDLPWYELTPKEQKNLLIIMNCDGIQKGFTAAGIHDMTIERFAIIMKAGYTNLLVLKDIVMK